MKNGIKFASQALATFVLVVGVLVLVAGVIIPRLTGAETYAVLANSMAPRYPIGTLMVVRPADTISAGDIITYQIAPNDPMVVSHRVVGIVSSIDGEPRFITRGDSNNAADLAPVAPEQIRGVMWYAIPFAGYLVLGVNSGREFANIIGASLLAIYAIWQVARSITEKTKANRQVPPHASEPQSDGVALGGLSLENTTEPLENAVPDAVSQFLPTMTRAERRRLAAATIANADQGYSLVS